jgi:hypothetical protein
MNHDIFMADSEEETSGMGMDEHVDIEEDLDEEEELDEMDDLGDEEDEEDEEEVVVTSGRKGRQTNTDKQSNLLNQGRKTGRLGRRATRSLYSLDGDEDEDESEATDSTADQLTHHVRTTPRIRIKSSSNPSLSLSSSIVHDTTPKSSTRLQTNTLRPSTRSKYIYEGKVSM